MEKQTKLLFLFFRCLGEACWGKVMPPVIDPHGNSKAQQNHRETGAQDGASFRSGGTMLC